MVIWSYNNITLYHTTIWHINIKYAITLLYFMSIIIKYLIIITYGLLDHVNMLNILSYDNN